MPRPLLQGFIQIIPDICTFVHPVFSLGDKVALQCIEDEKLVSFQKFEMDSSVVEIPLVEIRRHKIGAPALVGFQPNQETLWVGTSCALSRKISEYWLVEALNNPSLSDVVEDVQEFLRVPRYDAHPLFRDRLYMFERLSNGLWNRVLRPRSIGGDRPYELHKVMLEHNFSEEYRTVSFSIPESSEMIYIRQLFEEIGEVKSISFSAESSVFKAYGRHKFLQTLRRHNHKSVQCTVIMKSRDSVAAAKVLATSLQKKGYYTPRQGFVISKSINGPRFISHRRSTLGVSTGRKKV